MTMKLEQDLGIRQAKNHSKRYKRVLLFLHQSDSLLTGKNDCDT
jgi:hypothetical protein